MTTASPSSPQTRQFDDHSPLNHDPHLFNAPAPIKRGGTQTKEHVEELITNYLDILKALNSLSTDYMKLG